MSTNETRHTGPAASVRRLRLVARHTLGEALHLRLTLLLVLGAGGLMGVAFWLREFNFGSAELKFLADFGLGAIGLFGTVLAALVTGQLFLGELENGAAGCVLARPVRRWEYVWGKFLGIAGVLALFTATLGLLLALVLAGRAAQLRAAPAGVQVFVGACALQWLKLTLVAALTLLVASYARSALFASCAGLLLTLIAHLRPFAAGGLGWLRLWPNLALFDSESLLAAGAAPSGNWLLQLGLYWAAYVAVLGALASHVFKNREL